jgi:hypothetical protein
MDELMGFMAGFAGGCIASMLAVAMVKVEIEKKINDMKVQLFALRVELNKWNDDNTV